MKVSNQFHAPVALKFLLYPLARRLGGGQSRSGVCGFKKILLPLPEIEPWTSRGSTKEVYTQAGWRIATWRPPLPYEGLHKHTENWNRWGALPVHPRGIYLIGMLHPSSHRNSFLLLAGGNNVLSHRGSEYFLQVISKHNGLFFQRVLTMVYNTQNYWFLLDFVHRPVF
jgi:hypothetical protein